MTDKKCPSEREKKIARIVPPSFPTERPRSMNDGDDDRHDDDDDRHRRE
jgi:hypothetical protein